MPVTTSFSDNEWTESVLHGIQSCRQLVGLPDTSLGTKLTSSSHTATRRIPTQNRAITPPTRQQATQARPKETTRILLQNHHLVFLRLRSGSEFSERIPGIVAAKHVRQLLRVPFPPRAGSLVQHRCVHDWNSHGSAFLNHADDGFEGDVETLWCVKGRGGFVVGFYAVDYYQGGLGTKLELILPIATVVVVWLALNAA